MSEQLPANNPENEQSQNRGSLAIEKALDGFAPDGDSWTEAKASFDQALESGRSYNTALDRAVATVSIRSEVNELPTESTTSEAAVRFWDNMDPNVAEGETPTPAIVRALDGYAENSETWKRAYNTFTNYIEANPNSPNVDIALVNALSVAVGGSETHPEIARDRFYGGVDPDYAEADHYKGSKYGVRLEVGDRKYEAKLGPSAEKRRQRKLGKLAAEHSQR